MFNFKLNVRNEHKLHTKVKNEHKISIKSLEATVYEKLTLYIRYRYKTCIDKVLVFVRLLLKPTSYRVNSSVLASRILSKLQSNSLKYSSATSKREKFLIKNLLNKISFRGANSLKEQFFLRGNLQDTTYRINSGQAIEGMFLKLKDSLLYRSFSEISTNIISKIQIALHVSSNSFINVLFHIREQLINTFKSVDTLRESIFSRIDVFNNSQANSEIEKDGLSTKTLLDGISDFYGFVSEKANVIISKISLTLKIRSKSEIDESKMFQYYARKLNEYTDTNLNELPKDLLRVCYVTDKDWELVGRMYKTWAEIKDRVTSWSDLK